MKTKGGDKHCLFVSNSLSPEIHEYTSHRNRNTEFSEKRIHYATLYTYLLYVRTGRISAVISSVAALQLGSRIGDVSARNFNGMCLC